MSSTVPPFLPEPKRHTVAPVGTHAASPNFGFLAEPLHARLGALSELHALRDPNSSLLKARQLAEALLQSTAARLGIPAGPEGSRDPSSKDSGTRVKSISTISDPI